MVTTEQKQGLCEGSNHVTMPQAEGTSDIKCHSSIRKCLVKDSLLWHFYCCCSSLIYFLSFNYFHLNFIELFKLLSASRLLCILSLCLGHSFLCSHLSDFLGLHPRPWPMKPPPSNCQACGGSSFFTVEAAPQPSQSIATWIHIDSVY